MNMANKSQRSKAFCLIIAIAIIVLSAILSNLIEYNPLQVRAIGILSAALILWISNALPMSIATLLLVFLLPILGLMKYDDVLANFGIGTTLFIMASSGITVAVANSNIPYKITEIIFNKAGNHPILLVYSVGLAVTVFSGFVSSLATCTLFTSLIASAFNNMKLSTGESKLAKVMMLAVPVCSGIGGFISPAGTPANLLVLEWLKANGVDITFAKWCIIGGPVCLISVIVFLTLAVLIFKPEKLNYKAALTSRSMDKKDLFILITVCLVILGWFLSSFIASLNITLVAIIGLSLLMIPSARVINFEQFSKGVNWDLVFTMGSVSILMTAVANTGIVTKIASVIVNNLPSSNLFLFLFGLSLVICFIRAFVPTTTAVIALLLPMLVDIAKISDFNCGALLLVTAYWAATALLLVFTEPIFLISYKEGYFKQKDLLKVGVPTNIILAAACPILIYSVYAWIG